MKNNLNLRILTFLQLASFTILAKLNKWVSMAANEPKKREC